MNWVSIETTALDVARSVTGLAVNSLCQSTLLIVAGFIFAWLLRRRGSAVQSAIYRTTLIAVLMCPFATWILARVGMSGWSIEMPVAWQLAAQPELPNSKVSPEQDAATGDHDSSSLAAPPNAVGVPAPVDMASDTALAARLLDGSGSHGNSRRNSGDAARVITLATESASETIGEARAVGIRRFGWIAMGACVVWFVVATALLARLSLAWRQLAVTRRRALPADDETVRMCREVAALFGVRPPDVKLSPFLPSPCLAGLRRPVVLLPDAEFRLALHDVLIHELAHLARHDCQWNLARRLATSLFFFQPLLWRLSRQMETSAEEVCDDCVVLLGKSRREYAHQLVDMAELSTARLAAAGVGIVSFRSMLGRRVARIMDTSRSLSTRVGGVLIAIVLIAGLTSTLLVGLVGIRPNHATAADAASSADESGVKQANDASAEPAQTNDIVTVRGHVVDQDDKPVAGATVCADWVFTGDNRSRPRSQPSEQFEHVVVAQTKSGPDGAFELAFSKKSPHENRISESWHIVAFAAGFAPAWKREAQLVNDTSPELRLTHAEPVQGRIVDLEGKPISGVRVKVHELRPAKSEQALQDWIAKAKETSAAKSVNDYLSIMTSASDSDGSYPAAFPALWNDGILANGSPALPVDTRTDADGRFQFDSLGDNRLATIEIESPVLAKCYLPVITRQLDALSARPPGFVGIRSGTYYGRKFEFVAEPTQPIEGTVTDADSGEPLADFQVQLGQFSENLFSQGDFLGTRTDEQGKYQLIGAPQGGGHRIDVEPTPDQPYFVTQKKLDSTTSSFEPIRCDFALKRGKWIEGKVSEQVTGKPIVDATVDFLPLRSNEFAKAFSNYRPEITGSAPSERYRTDKDGRFRVLAIPGPGILGAIAHNDDRQLYASLSAEDVPPRLIGEAGHLNAYHPWVVTGYHALREVELPESSDESTNFDLQFKRGLTRQVTFKDNDGQPITGVRVLGRGSPSTYLEEPLHVSTVELIGLRPNSERIVVLIQPEKRIGRALQVSTGDELTVELQPCAIVHGRFIDGEGEPVRDAAINVTIDAPDNWHRGLIGSTTDNEGRFEALLPPGMTCRVWHYQMEKGPNFSAECQATPDAVFELGDLVNGAKLRTVDTAKLIAAATVSPKKVEGKDATETSTNEAEKKGVSQDENAIEYSGQVVTPDGKPADGAKIFLVYHIPQATEKLEPSWQPLAVTGPDGKFRFTVQPASLPGSKQEWSAASIVAVADGLGFAWSQAALFETSGKFLAEYRSKVANLPAEFRPQLEKTLAQAGQPLHLVADDEPVRGQIVDINGQPVSGARLTLLEAWACWDDDLSPWLEATKVERADYYSARMKTPRLINGPQVRSLVTPAITDTSGRFTLHGIGRERIAELLVEGPGVETSKIFARTRAGEKIELANEWRSPQLDKYVYYPAELTYVAGPSKPIVGMVRDRKSGEPLAGVTIMSQHRHGHAMTGWGEDFVRAVTDSAGHYRLDGMPIGSENRVGAVAALNLAYLPTSKAVNTDVAGAEINLEFDLQPAVWVNGLVIDKQSGIGVPGSVEYFAFPDKSHTVPRNGDGNVDLRDQYQAGDQGHFRIPVLPGRGIIAFQAFNGDRYPRGAGADAISGADKDLGAPSFRTEPAICVPMNYHALAEVNPGVDAHEIEVKFSLDAGHNVFGKVVGPDDKPLDDFRYAGKLAEFASWDMPDGDRFEVTGYDPLRPRHLYFYQAEQHLAGKYDLSGAPPDDFVVKLQPAGKVSGRLVDNQGEPLVDMMLVRWQPAITSPTDTKSGDSELAVPPLPPNVSHWREGQYITDTGGRFEISGLIPGVEYRIRAIDRAGMMPTERRISRLTGTLAKTIQVESGQVLELGDVQLADEPSSKSPTDPPKPPAGSPSKREPDASANPKGTSTGDAKTSVRPTADDTNPEQITGHVVGPDGKPVSGAKLFWITWSLRGVNPDAQQVATAGADGSFRLVPPKDDATFVSVEGIAVRNIVVVADGYGMAYVPSQTPRRGMLDLISQALAGRTIQLPEEAAIRGHLVDIEGQPIAGAHVRIRKLVDKNDQFAGDARELQARDPSTDAEWLVPIHNLLNQFFPQQLPTVAPTATTGADGRFELRGVGPNRLVQLLITGDGAESTLLLARTAAGPSITLTPDRHADEKPITLYGPDFDYALGPSRPVEGRVVDLDTGSPIADAVVRTYEVHGDRLSSSREREHLATRTDANGVYRIFGLPVGDGNKLVAFTTGDIPYVPVGHSIDTSTGDARVQQDFRLKRGVWAAGRAYDAQSKQPLTGELSYYWFRNAELEQAIPGLREAFVDENYFTDAKGGFRVPVLAARGVLAFRYAPLNSMDAARYPRGIGAAAITGAQGSADFTTFPTYPFYLMASNYQMLAEVNPIEGQEKIDVDLPLSAGVQLTVHAVDESQQALTSVEFYGRAPNWGWNSGSGAACEILAIQAGERRKIFFFHRGRNLAGAAIVDEHTTDGLTVSLKPAGRIRGRLIDADGQPISDATVTADYGKLSANPDAAIWPASPDLRSSPDQIPVDKEGRFHLDGIAPGWKYSAWAVAPRKMQGQMMSRGIGRVFDDLTLEPGEDRDLGDIRVVEKDETPTPASNESSKASATAQRTRAASSDSPRTHIHGRVVGPEGKPVRGAHVAVFAFKRQESRGGDLDGSRNEVLAEIATDEDGSYSLELVGLSLETHFSATLVAGAADTALAWQPLNPDVHDLDAPFILQADTLIRGRLVNIEGQPAANVQMTIGSIMNQSQDGQPGDSVGFGDFKSPSTVLWPKPITSDADGRFVIHNVAAGQGVFLNVAGTDRFAPQQLALNTGLPEQRGDRDGTYRSQVVKNLKPQEEAVLPLAPAQMIEGVVRYEDTGEPAPNARLTVWASQQEHGSMISVGGRAGENGRYRISPYPGIRFGVTAYPPDGTPYLVRRGRADQLD